jgi:hypothetical protein
MLRIAVTKKPFELKRDSEGLTWEKDRPHYPNLRSPRLTQLVASAMFHPMLGIIFRVSPQIF